MVLVAAASDHRHRHRRAAKSSAPANPATPSPAPAAKPSARSPLYPFSFTWGAQRRLRCSNDGAPVYASASTSPSTKGKEETPQQDPPPPGCSSSRPQRPRNLRPLRSAARSDGNAPIQSPYPAAPPEPPSKPRKRGFAVALTKEEIARDFAAIRRCTPSTTKKRPVPAARRAKKRPKAVQNKIDAMFPGFKLFGVDLDNYTIDSV